MKSKKKTQLFSPSNSTYDSGPDYGCFGKLSVIKPSHGTYDIDRSIARVKIQGPPGAPTPDLLQSCCHGLSSSLLSLISKEEKKRDPGNKVGLVTA